MDTVDDYSEVQMSPVVKLTDGIDMRKLIDDSFTTFKVDVSDNVENNVSYFDKDELLQCVNFDCINADSDEDSSSVEPEETPFQKIASKMTNLTQDGKVKKREIQPGSGCIVPERALVTVHYNAYVEYGDEPYDSTWLRGYPKMGHLGQSFIIGLDIGIASMKKGETSRFLLHPDVAYGKLGCPPRIPQKNGV
ncbi:inactive peptidyl-prolyl cis-trans isomerase FKBP6 isoform X2 [Zootermopsis nevadensis]|uniref:peptidylprolyl isomerase n=1 Tax=Zootermopsis nevadensis TaxID=136037 RepID=A0A067R0C9_ZOONE|nr:inactive peptidyl-prolyl cis-trans isomerase FKBP6 isoform X2 [Zootermopsis nevadensis]KDR15352.1 FK506-binding protein 6 [Zootermopsis nevadensis]